MNILAIDTSGPHLFLVLYYKEKIFEHFLTTNFQHTQFLLPGIDLLFETAQVSPRNDIQLIACSYGPGSFTGLRIGVTTAKALSVAWDIPLVFISSLSIYGYKDFLGYKCCLSVIDARKSKFYVAWYQNRQIVSDEYDLSVSELEKQFCLNNLKEPLVLTGPGAAILYEQFVHIKFLILDSFYMYPGSRAMIFLAREKFQRNEISHIQDGPNYVRKSDAELWRDSNLNKKFGIKK